MPILEKEYNPKVSGPKMNTSSVEFILLPYPISNPNSCFCPNASPTKRKINTVTKTRFFIVIKF
jgi:hypothetical protein